MQKTLSTTRIAGFMLAMAAAACAWAGSGCSGNQRVSMLGYQAGESVKFTISGIASCSACVRDEVPVVGMQIEIVPKDDPSHAIVLKPFDGLGAFTIPSVTAENGRTLEILGTLFLEGGADPSTIEAYAEIEAPSDDGDVVSLTLNFPSSAQ